MMKQMYKGCLINYREHTNEWIARDGESDVIAASSLVDAKAAVDKHLAKERGVFKLVPVYSFTYSQGLVSGEVTSEVDEPDDGYGQYQSYYVWAKLDGSRKKVRTDEVFPVTPESTAIVDKITALQKAIDAAEEDINTLKGELVPYKHSRNSK